MEQQKTPLTDGAATEILDETKTEWQTPDLVKVSTRATESVGLGNNDGAASHT